jgi:nitrogen fixation-related uncharacterized protein
MKTIYALLVLNSISLMLVAIALLLHMWST